MNQQAGALLPSAFALSVAAHALLLLLPYRPTPPHSEGPQRVLIPVSLVEQAPRPARPMPAAVPAHREPAPVPVGERSVKQPAPEVSSELPVAPAEEAPRTEERPTEMMAAQHGGSPAAAPAGGSAGGSAVDIEAAASGQTSVSGDGAVAQAGAEIAAYSAILSTLRDRIVRQIRYPRLARAKGWQGTVVVSARLDAAGGLEQAIVRRSSGFEVLDRSAVALVRKVTPVGNPLAHPLVIEIPIVFELK